MGLTFITATVINPAHPRKQARVRFLVDSGAVYTIAPATLLRKLAIRPHGRRTFLLADGTEMSRAVGDAVFAFDGQKAASPVIFGEKGDSTLFGTVSLEALGLMLDPVRRRLRPLPMLLG